MTAQPANSKDRLTVNMVAEPAMYRLSILISDRAIDVAITSRVRDNDIISRHIDFNPALGSSVRGLEEAVYDNPLLTADFGRVDVLIDTNRFFLLPADEVADAEGYMRRLYPEDTTETPLEAIVNVIEPNGAAFVMAADRDVARFVRRTWGNPAITHRLAALARYHSLRSHLGNSGKMHVRLHPDNRTDIIALGHRGIMLANTYETRSAEDAVYYTLAAARHLGYDNDADRIFASGDRALRDAYITAMRRFVPFVMPEIQPASLPANGTDKTPFELLILPLCE